MRTDSLVQGCKHPVVVLVSHAILLLLYPNTPSKPDNEQMSSIRSFHDLHPWLRTSEKEITITNIITFHNLSEERSIYGHSVYHEVSV